MKMAGRPEKTAPVYADIIRRPVPFLSACADLANPVR